MERLAPDIRTAVSAEKTKRTKKSKVVPKTDQEDISQSLASAASTSGITATPTVADTDTTVRKPGVVRIAGPVILSWE